MKKQFYKDLETIAVYANGLEGLEIKAVNEDMIYFMDSIDEKVHKAIIKWTDKRGAYFRYRGRRIHLDECIRTNWGY